MTNMKLEDNSMMHMIEQKFPRQSQRIYQLYEENADFRSLCNDYFTCMQILRKFKRSLVEEGKSVEEYEKVQTELEKELYDFLFP